MLQVRRAWSDNIITLAAGQKPKAASSSQDLAPTIYYTSRHQAGSDLGAYVEWVAMFTCTCTEDWQLLHVHRGRHRLLPVASVCWLPLHARFSWGKLAIAAVATPCAPNGLSHCRLVPGNATHAEADVGRCIAS